MIPLLKGKYYAFCEGDDYWCDELKLQKQIDYLDRHTDYVACVHNTEYHYSDTDKRKVRYSTEDRDLSLADCIMRGGQSYHTSSLIVRSGISHSKPQFTKMIAGVGDYPSAVYYALSGKIRYMGDVMSVYRLGTAGSWTAKIKKDRKKMLDTVQSTIEMLKEADAYSNNQYHELFEDAIEFHRYRIYIYHQEYKKAIQCGKTFKKERFFTKVRYIVCTVFPFSVKLRNFIVNKYESDGKIL